MASYDSDSSLETDMESIFSSNSDYQDTSSKSHYSAATDHSVHSRHTTVDSEDDPRGLTKKKKKVVIHQPESSLPHRENRRRSLERRRLYVEDNKEAVIIPAKSSRRKDSRERILTYYPHHRQSSINRRLSFSEDPRLPAAPTLEHHRRELSDYPLALRDEIERQRAERDEIERQRVERDRRQRIGIIPSPRHYVKVHERERQYRGQEKVIQDAIIADREREDRQAQHKDREEIDRIREEEYEEHARRRAERGPGLVRRDSRTGDLRSSSREERPRRFL